MSSLEAVGRWAVNEDHEWHKRDGNTDKEIGFE